MDGESPKTQSIESVKNLLTCIGRSTDPMPSLVDLAGGVRLTKSSKGDVYYTTTPTACSCPARNFNPNKQCEHMKALLAESSRAQAKAHQARQRELRAKAKARVVEEPQEPAKRLARPPGDCIRPDMAGFKPFSLLPSEEKTKAILSMLIDLFDTTEREASYWSIEEDKALWPAEA